MGKDIKLINIDCLQAMKQMPDNSFDLAIVDPPYGINAPNMQMGMNKNRNDGFSRGDSTAVKIKKGRLNRGSGKLKGRSLNTMNCDWDYTTPSKEYFTELQRVSVNQVICGGNYFDLPPTRGIVCWDKMQPWDNFSQLELIWTSFDTPAKMFYLSNTGGANNIQKIHPTQKPVALYEWILKQFADENNTILDTHLGSGSIAIACHNLSFDLTGYEIDNSYYTSAVNRLDRHTSQLQMFL